VYLSPLILNPLISRFRQKLTYAVFQMTDFECDYTRNDNNFEKFSQ
jgi:hypothetical protein